MKRTVLFAFLFCSPPSFAGCDGTPVIIRTEPLSIQDVQPVAWPRTNVMLIRGKDDYALYDLKAKRIRHVLGRLHGERKLGPLWWHSPSRGMIFKLERGFFWIEDWEKPEVGRVIPESKYESLSKAHELSEAVRARVAKPEEESFAWHLSSLRDDTRDEIIYYRIPHFDSEPEDWKARVWYFAPDGRAMGARDFVAGPWVYSHGLFKWISCFSCGCSCYEQATLRVKNGVHYLNIGGEAVDEEHQGLYRYHLREGQDPGRWIQIQAGDVYNLTVAPDGASAAYIFEDRVYVARIDRK